MIGTGANNCSYTIVITVDRMMMMVMTMMMVMMLMMMVMMMMMEMTVMMVMMMMMVMTGWWWCWWWWWWPHPLLVTRQWAWPTGTTQTESTFQQYTVRSLFCWVKFIFLPALFWMPFLGKSLEHDFLLFHIGIITMHWLGRSQKYRNGYFSFQNCSTTKNDSKDSFFSGLTT